MDITTMKPDRVKFEFSEHFNKKFDMAMKLYQMMLDQLNDNVHSTTNCEYGYCSNKYSVRLITPNDISTFVSHIMKAFSIGIIEYNVDDMQKFAVESVYRFLEEREETPFNDTNTLGAFTNTYVNPKDFTLTDLLVIAKNEVFPTNLKSNYEIGIQKENIKEDLKKVNDMHFSGVMKNIVKALPGIIDKSDTKFLVEAPLKAEVFRNIIESFIIFAVTLNTITVCGMKNYVDPCTTYNTKAIVKESAEVEEDDDELDEEMEITQESVDTTKNKPVFIVLSEGKTPILSDAIRAKTKSNYSHASISFDPTLKEMWSYGRPSLNPDGTINNIKFGFKNESIDERVFRGKNIVIGVYAIFVKAKDVKKMENYIKGYLGMKTKFDWGAMFDQLLSRDAAMDDNKFTRICSTFVNTVLSQAGINITGKNSPNPADFARSLDSESNKRVIKVFYGDSNDYDPKKINKKLKQFSKRKTSVTYESFVTECCLLKTPVSKYSTKIPFGCNFRELVLGDMTPDFKDVKSAIYYIIKNPKSPIAQLLTKYVNTRNICNYAASDVTQMLFKFKPRQLENNDWYHTRTGRRIMDDPYDVTDFHTDVNWLDKIVYGDTFYDGNYRRDNMGNQAVHPIVNVLDTIYHSYGGKRLTTNEELANHVISIGNVMLGIIQSYNFDNRVENNQLIKDVLAVFGEILTRTMLKLYHNNTIVVDASDAMPDAMDPGYLYTEAFVMEADGANNANGNNNPNGGTTGNNTGTPTVTVTTRNNQTVQGKINNASMKVGNMLSQLIRWINDTLAKAPIKFTTQHKLEITWVGNNKATNDQIKGALNSKNFNITVNNFPSYNINITEITNINTDPLTSIDTTMKSNIASNKSNAGDVATSLFHDTLPAKLKAYLDKNPNADKDAVQTAVENFVLYGDPVKPQNANQGAVPLTGDMFEDLVNNILNTQKALEQVSKISKDLAAAANSIKNKLATAQAPTGNNKGESQGQFQTNVDQLTNVEKALTMLANAYAAPAMNTIANKLFKDSYSVYRDVVQAYKQEGTPNSTQQAQPAAT